MVQYRLLMLIASSLRDSEEVLLQSRSNDVDALTGGDDQCRDGLLKVSTGVLELEYFTVSTVQANKSPIRLRRATFLNSAEHRESQSAAFQVSADGSS